MKKLILKQESIKDRASPSTMSYVVIKTVNTIEWKINQCLKDTEVESILRRNGMNKVVVEIT